MLAKDEKDKLKELLVKYKGVFNNKPGCHKSYIYYLQSKDNNKNEAISNSTYT